MATIDISCDCDAKHLTYSVTDSHGVTQLVSFCAECAHGAAADWDTDGAIVKIVRDEPTEPTTFVCKSEDGSDVEYVAATALQAAKLFADDEVGDIDRTHFVNVLIAPADDLDAAEWYKVQVDPAEPDCDDVDHAWQDGPVRGNGGGVVYTDTCAHCGCRRHVDTWGADPFDGTQGYRIVRYLPAVSE